MTPSIPVEAILERPARSRVSAPILLLASFGAVACAGQAGESEPALAGAERHDTPEGRGSAGSLEPFQAWTHGVQFGVDSVGIAADGTLLVAGGYVDQAGHVVKLSRARIELWSQPLVGEKVDARVAGAPDGGAAVAHTFWNGGSARNLQIGAFATDGTRRWTREFLNADFETISVAADSTGSVWIAGTAFGSQDFGWGAMALDGGAFVVAFDASGATTFSTVLAGPAFASSAGIVVTPGDFKFVVVENGYEAVTGPPFTVFRLDALGSPQWTEDVESWAEAFANGPNMARVRATADGGVAFSRHTAPVDTFALDEQGNVTQWFMGGRGVAPTPSGDVWVTDGQGVGGPLILHRLPAGGGTPITIALPSGTSLDAVAPDDDHLVIVGQGPGLELEGYDPQAQGFVSVFDSNVAF